MPFYIYIAVYLFIGIILSFFGKAAREINNEIKDLKHPDIDRLIDEGHIYAPHKYFLFEFTMRMFLLILWPFLYTILLIDFINESRGTEDDKILEECRYEREAGLFFSSMGGAGEITCRECGYHQHLVSFIHSFPIDKWNQSGYQCQRCGLFHEIENAHQYKGKLKCYCGGSLSRDKVLFCPVYKSKNLKYEMEYVT